MYTDRVWLLVLKLDEISGQEQGQEQERRRKDKIPDQVQGREQEKDNAKTGTRERQRDSHNRRMHQQRSITFHQGTRSPHVRSNVRTSHHRTAVYLANAPLQNQCIASLLQNQRIASLSFLVIARPRPWHRTHRTTAP
jgi:hypothetical protein